MHTEHELSVAPRPAVWQTGWWVGVILLALSACAGAPDQSGSSVDKREIVARIAQSRWDALLKGDIEAAYDLLTPASRTIVTLETFRRKSGLVAWKEARISGVVCSAEDLCTASVTAKYAYTLRTGQRVENEQYIAETWRNVSGAWRYVPPDLQ